ncbi:MAG TPA: hypothetical protein VN944_01965, partial [Nitrospiria bacterium]|nr:hypothetical protein [Nitrospiria bacterium]
WRVWIKVGWIDHFIEALGYTMEFSKVLNDRLDRAVEDNLQRSVVIESAKTFLLKEIASRQMVVKDSLPFLRSKGLSWQEARDLLKSNDGILWSMRKIYRQGNPKLLIPLKG